MRPRADTDIARNLKSVEWLKIELLSGVSDLYRAMRQAEDEAVLEHLGNIVMAAYILGRRLGVDFAQLDEKVKQKIQANVRQPHDFEEWYGDFSALERHINSGER